MHSGGGGGRRAVLTEVAKFGEGDGGTTTTSSGVDGEESSGAWERKGEKGRGALGFGKGGRRTRASS